MNFLQHYASIGYAIIVTLLMIAMIVAFIWAHVSYNEKLEEAKKNLFKGENIKFLPCFYCGADENLLKVILITLIGSFFVGTICILIWAWFKGTFRNVEKVKFNIFEAERRNE